MTDVDAPSLAHLDPQATPRLTDISDQPRGVRTAVAAGRVCLGREAFERVREHDVRKGDVLTVAQIAGIQGAKEASRLIPLCHGLNLNGVDVELELNAEDAAVEVRAYAKTVGPTGVAMEAMTAVSMAALTIYDMCKSISREIEITDVRLLAQTGGQSGDYRREEDDA